MDIKILHLLEGAREAKGLTVLIDVFRAFSTACYVYHAGAATIRPVAFIDDAFKLKEQYPDFLLMGERNEIKPHGFDYGNSPYYLLTADLKGKTLVHTTSAGTQGITAATNATEIITGSFVNADAVVNYINFRKPDHVSLVCMGYACQYPTDEDSLCAEYFYKKLHNQQVDFNNMVRQIKNGSGKRFFEKHKQEWAPQQDFELCLNINRFNFVLNVRQDAIGTLLLKTEPPFFVKDI